MRAARLLSATAPLRTASTAATAPSKPASAPAAPPIASTNPLESSYSDLSTLSELDASGTDWTRSFAGLSSSPFSKEAANVLLAPLDPLDVEIKPGEIDLPADCAHARADGIVYLPEISPSLGSAAATSDAPAEYRRILNRAFGPGGWGLAPRGPASVAGKAVSREYALVCLGRCVGPLRIAADLRSLVSVARGEQTFFDPSGVATAAEGAKSNALMRCCKDLGVASELWCVG